MRLIVGLGNPGNEYRNNRHNVGQMVIEKLQNSKTPKLQSLVTNYKSLVLSKTTTYMNNSGEFVRKLVEQYHLNPSDLWIIHDDLDIPLGSYKIQFGRGPRLHNGVNSIERELGTDGFWRVRIGIENRMLNAKWPIINNKKISGDEYVLQDFTEEEREILGKTIEKLLIGLIDLISK